VQVAHRLLFQDQRALFSGEFSPFAGGKVFEAKASDTDPDQSKRGMADRSGHPSDLAILAFNKLKSQPASRDRLSKPDGRVPIRDVGLGVEDPRLTFPRAAALNPEPALEFCEN
jgi:hypothetical protein